MMTRDLLANITLGVLAIALGGLFVARDLDVIGIACDLLGVLYMHAAVRRYSA